MFPKAHTAWGVKELLKSNNKNNMKNYNFNQFKFDLNKLPEVSRHQER